MTRKSPREIERDLELLEPTHDADTHEPTTELGQALENIRGERGQEAVLETLAPAIEQLRYGDSNE